MISGGSYYFDVQIITFQLFATTRFVDKIFVIIKKDY